MRNQEECAGEKSDGGGCAGTKESRVKVEA